MKKLSTCLSIFSFVLMSSSFTFGQSWDWGIEGTGSVKSNDYGTPVAIDDSGNAYITGQYYGSINFGNFTLASSGENVYLAKYDPLGNVIWAVQPTDIGYYSNSFGTSITIDGIGNVYITGRFSGELIFGNYPLQTDSFNSTVFLAKYTSSGKVIWAKQATIPYYKNILGLANQSLSVTSDQSNNILLTGNFKDSITFGNYTLTSPGTLNSSAFLVKYNPSGNVTWANQSVPGIKSGTGTGNSVITDKRNNIYITGNFKDSISFGSYTLAGYGLFITKYSAAGKVLWAKQSENSFVFSSNAIVRDEKPNIYIAGYFSDTMKLGHFTLYSSNPHYQYSSFLAKYDTNGNVIWAKQSSQGMEATSMSEDGTNDIYMAGRTVTKNSYHFGGFPLQALHKRDTTNAFLLKFDTAGTVICGSLLDNLSYNDQAVGIAANYYNAPTSYIYMAGTFGKYDTVVCGPDILPASNTTTFLGRWLECTTDAGVNEVKGESEQVKAYPNPSNGVFQLEITNYKSGINNEIEVYNVLGAKVYSTSLLISNSSFLINLSNQPNGVYLYRVITETGNLVGEGKLAIER